MGISKIYAALIATIAAPLILAPAARADTADDERMFLTCVGMNGVALDNDADSLRLGRLVNSDLHSGVPQTTVQSKLMSGVSMSQRDAYQFMACAAASRVGLSP